MNEPITRSPTFMRVTSEPTLLDHARALVPEDLRPAGEGAVDHREVGVAHAAGGDPHDHVAGAGVERGVTSSTDSGWFCSRKTAAFMGFPRLTAVERLTSSVAATS